MGSVAGGSKVLAVAEDGRFVIPGRPAAAVLPILADRHPVLPGRGPGPGRPGAP
jgi:hypothetical protein